MPKLTGTIGGSDYRPSAPVLAEKNTIKADALVNLTKTAATQLGSGFAEGRGERQLGSGETAEEASNVVSEAFNPVPPSGSGVEDFQATAEPSKEEMEDRKRSFLSRADLNDKRLQAALDQGRISSAEANNRRIQNRKEAASNPITALYMDDYDRAVGGGTSGAGRKAFFGKTAAEQAAEATTVRRITAAAERDEKVEALLRGRKNMTRENAYKTIDQMEANTTVIAALEQQSKLGALGQNDAVRLFKANSTPVYMGIAKSLNDIHASGTKLKEEDAQAFRSRLSQEENLLLAQVDASGIFPENKDKIMERIKARFTGYRAQVDDAGYTKAMMAITAQNQAKIDNITSAETLAMIEGSKALRRAYVISNNSMAPVLDLMMDLNSMEGQWNVANNPGLAYIMEDTDKALEDADAALDKLSGGGGDLEEKEGAVAGLSFQTRGVPTLLAESYKKDPETFVKTFKGVTNLNMHKLSKDREMAGLIEADPSFGATIIEAIARKSVVNQMTMSFQNIDKVTITREEAMEGNPRFGRVAPLEREVSTTKRGQLPSSISMWRQPSVHRNYNRPWNIDTGGVKLSDKFKEDIIGANKLAIAHPEIWNKEYDTAGEYINDLFTVAGQQRRDSGVRRPTEADKKAVTEPPLGAGFWAKYYNADVKIPEEERISAYERAQGIVPTPAVEQAAKHAADSGVFSTEMKDFGITPESLYEEMLNISKAETSGGHLPKDKQVSSGNAQGLFQVTESSARSVLENGQFGEKAAASVGKSLAEINEMSVEELRSFLLNDDKANAAFSAAIIMQKLQHNRNKGEGS